MKHDTKDLLRRHYDLAKELNKWPSFSDIQRNKICDDKVIARRFGSIENYRKFTIKECGNPVVDSNYLKSEPTAPISFNDCKNELNKVIGFTKTKLNTPKKYKHKTQRYLVLPCLHIPFHSKENLIEAVEWAKSKEVNTLVVAGDVLDCLALGHAGYKRNIRAKQFVPLEKEMAEGKVLLEYFSSNFANIKLMRGNHLERSRKRFTELVGPELMFLVNHDLMSLLSADFPNIEMVNTEDRYGNDISWIYQVGDCRICHAEVGSNIQLRPTVRVHNWFLSWDHYLELQPYNVLIECHTHQGGILPMNNGRKILVEGMCLCKEPQYALEPEVKYGHPQVNGVTYFEQNDGITDVNSIKQYIFQDMK